MKLIKRCCGCGKRILPWQKRIHTKLAGVIHKGCAFNAKYNYFIDKRAKESNTRLEVDALKALNEEEAE